MKMVKTKNADDYGHSVNDYCRKILVTSTQALRLTGARDKSSVSSTAKRLRQ